LADDALTALGPRYMKRMVAAKVRAMTATAHQ
jgi:hypothetical protein